MVALKLTHQINLDDTPLTFGKYKGMTPKDVARIDPSYVVWMSDTIAARQCSDKLVQYCKRRIRPPNNYSYVEDGDHDTYGDHPTLYDLNEM